MCSRPALRRARPTRPSSQATATQHEAEVGRSRIAGSGEDGQGNARATSLRFIFVALVGIALRRADPFFPAAALNQELPHVLAEVALIGIAVRSLAIAKARDALHQLEAAAHHDGVHNRVL